MIEKKDDLDLKVKELMKINYCLEKEKEVHESLISDLSKKKELLLEENAILAGRLKENASLIGKLKVDAIMTRKLRTIMVFMLVFVVILVVTITTTKNVSNQKYLYLP